MALFDDPPDLTPDPFRPAPLQSPLPAPPQEDIDPFAAFADEVPKPSGNPKGFGVQVRAPKSLADNLDELLAGGDPEMGGDYRKKAKPINHNARTAKFLADAGWAVTKIEKWQTLRSGFAVKIDYHGLFDFQSFKAGQPELYVQACSAQGKAQHLRDMTSTKPAFDNKKPKIDNLRWHLAQGHKVALVAWTKLPNGRYEAEVVKVTAALVDQICARKRK